MRTSLCTAALVLSLAACSKGPVAEKVAAPVATSAGPVKATFDLNGPEEAVVDSATALSDALSARDGRIVDLDLVIKPLQPAEGEGGETSYGVTLGSGEAGKPLTCEDWRIDAPTAFNIHFTGYNHLLLEILHAGSIEAPQVTASCEPHGSDGRTDFHVRGRYVVSVIPVPTAVNVQLRPVLGPPTQ